MALKNVVVQDGVVSLWGMVSTDNERRALRIAAENVPGVKGVEDHLTSIPTRRVLTSNFSETSRVESKRVDEFARPKKKKEAPSDNA